MAGSTGRDWQLTWPALLARSSGLLTVCSSTTRIAKAELPGASRPVSSWEPWDPSILQHRHRLSIDEIGACGGPIPIPSDVLVSPFPIQNLEKTNPPTLQIRARRRSLVLRIGLPRIHERRVVAQICSDNGTEAAIGEVGGCVLEMLANRQATFFPVQRDLAQRFYPVRRYWVLAGHPLIIRLPSTSPPTNLRDPSGADIGPSTKAKSWVNWSGLATLLADVGRVVFDRLERSWAEWRCPLLGFLHATDSCHPPLVP